MGFQSQQGDVAAEKSVVSTTDEAPVRRFRLSRGLWAAGGFLFFGLGLLGVVMPFIPTTPFLLVAAFCFARSSERLNTWFKSTKVYHAVLEDYVARRAMTVRSKAMVLIPVTILLGIGFALMGSAPAARVVLAVVWAAHIIYFGFVVATERGDGR